MRDSALINLHMIEAARENGVQRFLFSSSACVYPGYLQADADVTPLKEEDAYPADAEDGYGWEKLFMERQCRHYFEDYGLETRVVRFHNIYRRARHVRRRTREVAGGHLSQDRPGQRRGRDRGLGRRPADALVLLRRGLRRRHLSPDAQRLSRRRSTWARIAWSPSTSWSTSWPRSPASASASATTEPSRRASAARNSDNTRLREVLGWEPQTSLEEGLERTYAWIEAPSSAAPAACPRWPCEHFRRPGASRAGDGPTGTRGGRRHRLLRRQSGSPTGQGPRPDARDRRQPHPRARC